MRDFRNLLAWGRALASLSMFDAHPNFRMSQQHVRRLYALCAGPDAVIIKTATFPAPTLRLG
jgi:hypothetical protein